MVAVREKESLLPASAWHAKLEAKGTANHAATYHSEPHRISITAFVPAIPFAAIKPHIGVRLLPW